MEEYKGSPRLTLVCLPLLRRLSTMRYPAMELCVRGQKN